MVRLPKMGVQRARKRKEESRSKYVSIAIAFLMMVVIVLGGAMLSDANYSSSASDYRTRSAEGWSEDVRISYNSTADQEPAIAVEGEVVHIVWRSTWFGGQIFYTRSNDAGETWDEPVMIGPLDYGCLRPDIAVNGDDVHVVWDNNNASAREIRYLRSVDGGDTWFTERMISSDDGNNSLGPKIAVSEDGMDVHVVWVDERHADDSSPPNTEIYYNRSHDGGLTWEGEVRLTEADYASPVGGITVEGHTVHLVWYDERSGIFDVYYRRSIDNGATWEDESVLADSSNWDVGPDVAVWDGHVHAIWSERLSGLEYTIYHRRSIDGGITWESPQKIVNSNTSRSTGLDVDGNIIHVTFHDWRSDIGEVYYVNSTDNGNIWNPELRLTEEDGHHSGGSKIAGEEGKIHVVWVDERHESKEIYYKRCPGFINVPEFGHVIVPVISIIVVYICFIFNQKKKENTKGE